MAQKGNQICRTVMSCRIGLLFVTSLLVQTVSTSNGKVDTSFEHEISGKLETTNYATIKTQSAGSSMAFDSRPSEVAIPKTNIVQVKQNGESTTQALIIPVVSEDSVGIWPLRYPNISSTYATSDLRLCGYPPFVDEDKCHYNATISSCMNYGEAIAFGVVITIFGVLIIGANTLIPILVLINASMRTHHYFIKASLAVADTIVGFLLLFAVVPNIAWVTGISEKTLIYFPIEDTNSPNAIVIGATLTVSTTASLFHLLFLSIERFTAINWPFWYMRRRKKSVVYIIIILWVAAMITSFAPAVFPQFFAYQFQPTLLMHMMTLQPVNGSETAWTGPLYGTVTIIIPYMIMVGFCIATAVISFREIKKSKKKLGRKHGSGHIGSSCSRGSEDGQLMKERRMNPEISVFITIGIMVVAFTIMLVPFTIVMILFMAAYVDCDSYTLPYVTLFYVGLLNSLANGIIYSVRDPKLVNAAKNIFRRSKTTRSKTSAKNWSET